MRGTTALALCFLANTLLCDAWSTAPRGGNDSSSRRNLLKQGAVTAAGVFLGANSCVSVASAYPRRDVGDPATRSAATAAMNEQAYRTNNRLEASGFQLDTPEQEQERIGAAMKAFSYDDATSSTKSKLKTGYNKSPANKNSKQ